MNMTMEQDTPQEEAPSQDINGLQKLIGFIRGGNIALDMESEKLHKISAQCKLEYDLDLATLGDLQQRWDAGEKLARQVREAKNYPLENSANIKYPLLVKAALDFAANAYPEIVKGKDVVTCNIVGKDPQGTKQARADRVGEYMSWQHTDGIANWQEQTDELLTVLPVYGCMFRKSYPDRVRGFAKDLIRPQDIVMDYYADFETTPRFTHLISYYPYEIQEKISLQEFREFTYSLATDSQEPQKFLCQYTRLDLDEDGYPEPYEVIMHEESGEVVSITAFYSEESIKVNKGGQVAAVQPIQLFTQYKLLPAIDGCGYGSGFGDLLEGINEVINTNLNQLVDAGTLANIQGGFIGAGVRMQGGKMTVKNGQWNPVQSSGASLRDNIVPFPFNGPNVVLFQLLGTMLEAGEKLAGTQIGFKDIPANMGEGVALNLMERGARVYSAIFKRIHRALKREFGIQFELNRLYLPKENYADFHEGEDPQTLAEDFAQKFKADVAPISDPEMSTDIQRLGRATFLTQFKDDLALDPIEIRRRVFQAVGIADIDKLFAQQQQANPAMMALEELKLRLAQADLEKKQAETKEIMTRLPKIEAETANTDAATVNELAKAESKEKGEQLSMLVEGMRLIKEINNDQQAAQVGNGGNIPVEDAGSNASGGAMAEAMAAGLPSPIA